MKIASHNVAATVDECTGLPLGEIRAALVTAFGWRPIEEAEPFKLPERRIVALFKGFVAVAYWDEDRFNSFPKPFWFAQGRTITISRQRQPSHFLFVPEIGAP